MDSCSFISVGFVWVSQQKRQMGRRREVCCCSCTRICTSISVFCDYSQSSCRCFYDRWLWLQPLRKGNAGSCMVARYGKWGDHTWKRKERLNHNFIESLLIFFYFFFLQYEAGQIWRIWILVYLTVCGSELIYSPGQINQSCIFKYLPQKGHALDIQRLVVVRVY